MNYFALGVDYVEFAGVMPDANGNIAITWTQNVNDPLGGGEGDFNGMSLVTVPEPMTMAFMGLGLAGLLALRRRGQEIQNRLNSFGDCAFECAGITGFVGSTATKPIY